MPKSTSQELLAVLQTGWAGYVTDFEQLSASDQAAFLERQGYGRFHDLLAHIVAWWEECLKIVTSILDVSEIPSREYDIDAFNAAAVAAYQNWKDDDLLVHFENLREALLHLVADLPTGAFENRRIDNWLYACVVEHLKEHKIS